MTFTRNVIYRALLQADLVGADAFDAAGDRTDVVQAVGGNADVAAGTHGAVAVEEAAPLKIKVASRRQTGRATGVAVTALEQFMRGQSDDSRPPLGSHHKCWRCSQVTAGGQMTAVAQSPPYIDQAVTATGDARAVGQVQLPGGQARITQAALAPSATAGVIAGKIQVETSVSDLTAEVGRYYVNLAPKKTVDISFSLSLLASAEGRCRRIP
jgi:hypothetical protein